MMKTITTRIATAALLFAVGGTVVKAGTYRFSFDDQKNELTVLDRKTKEVIARSEARTEARTDGQLTMSLQLVDGASSKTLASISFDGEKQSYVLAGSTAAR
jgi:hypothetical protein